ncbi:MAG: helix-turn-helix transcriptional regulator [Coriobacteriales bacterium]
MVGFALYFAWMLVCFYWFYSEVLRDLPLGQKDVVQSFVFLGTVVGYLGFHAAGRRASFNIFEPPVLIGIGVCMLLSPCCACAESFGINLPEALSCVTNLLTGVAGAAGVILWLDICSRMESGEEYRFTSFSMLAGAALFALVMAMPALLQYVFTAAFGIGSLALVHYASPRCPANDKCALKELTAPKWRFTREIEPLMVAYGIVFGSTFVYLFNCGGRTLIIGLLFVLVGAAVMVILTLAGKEVGITVAQRALLFLTVLTCVSMPFAPDKLQLVIVGLMVASWAGIMAINYALMVRKTKENGWCAPAFRQLPLRLSFRAIGFFVGWLLSSCITLYADAHTPLFGYMHLAMAVGLVLVFVLCMPDAHHHDQEALSKLEGDGVEKQLVSVELSESELFDAKCAAAAELYGLSPRESDILGYLARGRNAAYLQEKFCISPHTVKSHIYSIYRKFDIHSQQKLMDFIEEYPLSEEELARYTRGE